MTSKYKIQNTITSSNTVSEKLLRVGGPDETNEQVYRRLLLPLTIDDEYRTIPRKQAEQKDRLAMVISFFCAALMSSPAIAYAASVVCCKIRIGTGRRTRSPVGHEFLVE